MLTTVVVRIDGVLLGVAQSIRARRSAVPFWGSYIPIVRDRGREHRHEVGPAVSYFACPDGVLAA